jgi:hypothetical protein
LSAAFLADPLAKQFSFEVCQRGKARSVVETQALKTRCETEFRAITDDIERKILVKTRAKTELGVTHN